QTWRVFSLSRARDISVTQRRSDQHGLPDRTGSGKHHLAEGAGDQAALGRWIRPNLDSRGGQCRRPEQAQADLALVGTSAGSAMAPRSPKEQKWMVLH